MMMASATGRWPAATESGAICAVAGQSQREMQEWMAAYPRLFAAKPFDGAMAGTLSTAMAFSGPWLSAAQLRMANKACLWAFGLDWLVDYVATSASELHDITGRCLAVAGGADPEPGDDLTCLLAEITRELAGARAFPGLGPVWRDELRRMLEAMTRESEWKHTGHTPSLPEYLGNADNHGFSFVFTAHWIHTGGPDADAGQDRVREASWAVQRVMRLLNDLGTYERDVSWGDLNALLLGVPRDEVERTLAELVDRCRELIGLLRAGHPELAEYLERQTDFCAGFYRLGDYWGTL